MRRRRDSGASLVEFALILPLLCLLLFGIIQFGIAYDKKQSINSAAREGARTAAIPTNTVDDIETSVENSYEAITSGTVTTTITLASAPNSPIVSPVAMPCNGNAGDTVIVVATVQHTLTIPFFGAPNLTLEGQGEFRCERSAI